jgi:hypothetical protein
VRWRACEHWNLIDVRRKGVYGGSSNVFSTSRSPTGKKLYCPTSLSLAHFSILMKIPLDLRKGKKSYWLSHQRTRL